MIDIPPETIRKRTEAEAEARKALRNLAEAEAQETREAAAYRDGYSAGEAGIAGDPPDATDPWDAAELWRRLAWHQGWRGGMINRLRKGRNDDG